MKRGRGSYFKTEVCIITGSSISDPNKISRIQKYGGMLKNHLIYYIEFATKKNCTRVKHAGYSSSNPSIIIYNIYLKDF